MNAKRASKCADIMEMYLDHNGVYDIRKSEIRRQALKEKHNQTLIPLWVSKFDLRKNKEDISTINNLVNQLFYKNKTQK